MTPWYSTANPDEVDRLEGVWSDAPTENAELCSMLLEIAKEQVIAYAPEQDTIEGVIVPGPVTVTRTNLSINPALAVSESQWLLAGGERSNAHAGAGYPFVMRRVLTAPGATGDRVSHRFTGLTVGATYRVYLSCYATQGIWAIWADESGNATAPQTLTASMAASGQWATLSGTFIATKATMYVQWCARSNAPTGTEFAATRALLQPESEPAGAYFDGNTPDQIIDGRTYDFAWTGAENASASVETYRPDVFVPRYPDRLVYAQLQQAKNLWNAGRSNGNGEAGAEGFSFTPRPLDKTIRSIIRPTTGAADVF